MMKVYWICVCVCVELMETVHGDNEIVDGVKAAAAVNIIMLMVITTRVMN